MNISYKNLKVFIFIEKEFSANQILSLSLSLSLSTPVQSISQSDLAQVTNSRNRTNLRL